MLWLVDSECEFEPGRKWSYNWLILFVSKKEVMLWLVDSECELERDDALIGWFWIWAGKRWWMLWLVDSECELEGDDAVIGWFWMWAGKRWCCAVIGWFWMWKRLTMGVFGYYTPFLNYCVKAAFLSRFRYFDKVLEYLLHIFFVEFCLETLVQTFWVVLFKAQWWVLQPSGCVLLWAENFQSWVVIPRSA